MQIFKCLIRHCETWNFAANEKVCITKQSRSLSQHLLEFIFVLPILIFLSLAIMEVALFWQDVNTIYNLNAEINANAALLTYDSMNLGTVCPAADDSKYPDGTYVQKHSAIATLDRIDKAITLTNPIYTDHVTAARNGDGTTEPFVLYKFTGGPMITPSPIDGVAQPPTPQITLWVDCRNPYEDGVTTQLEFYHKTLVMRATIPRFDKPEGIVIIPDKIFIASPKLNTLRHY